MSTGLLIILTLTIVFFVFRSSSKIEDRSPVDVDLGNVDDCLLIQQAKINDDKDKK